MKVSRLTIKGKYAKFLIDFLKEEFSDYHKQYSKNIHLFISSQFFLRVGSNLLTVVVVKYISKKSCEIDTITGGGGEGIFGITLNSEIDRNRYIINRLKHFCKQWKCKLLIEKM